MTLQFRLLLSLVIALAGASPAWADTLRVAAASSSQEALREIARDFEKETGHSVQFSFGASGKLFTQIANGAPFGLFFSADNEYPAKLAAQGLSETPRRYARGRLVLWVPVASPLDVKQGVAVLQDPRITKISLANPRVAPYGRAAVEVLRSEGIYDALAPKFVMGENVSQAAQFVDSGSAEVGLLPLSLAVSPKLAPRGTYFLVPSRLHQPIDADAALIKQPTGSALARQFLEYCLSGKAKATWRRYGLDSDE
ncbi:Molybdate-binding periplasmic protein precursor [compost metagenome]